MQACFLRSCETNSWVGVEDRAQSGSLGVHCFGGRRLFPRPALSRHAPLVRLQFIEVSPRPARPPEGQAGLSGKSYLSDRDNPCPSHLPLAEARSSRSDRVSGIPTQALARSRTLILGSAALLVVAGLALCFWLIDPTRTARISSTDSAVITAAEVDRESLQSRLRASLRDGR